MSEGNTPSERDRRSFGERGLSRFDAEEKSAWERVLKETRAVSQKLDTVAHKLDVLGRDMLALRADRTRPEGHTDKLESRFPP